ncbi:MAG: bifunctional folylpolyglutamate synthase/dihydrofolate synthase [SAR202 cluster bacterium]|nr:bifunctional folylpolyglutamate synthase/dihydrofolate synthase [SAR202 cluster bacterium]
MGLADFERTASHGHEFHLDRMGLLLGALGDPHLGRPTVHVAGTKGKGSTAAMVASVLQAQGYRVGLYTSPHLHSAVERIQVSGQPIAGADFAALVEQAWPVMERVNQDGGVGGVTTFELLTTLAFLHFRQAGADFQVIEVGLGGRLDSTNVVEPDVCVITPLSLDHTEILGPTVASIAREKAGIIKTGVPVLTAPQPPEAIEVLHRIAADRGAPLTEVARTYAWSWLGGDLHGQRFSITGPKGARQLWIPLLGGHQVENAATAIAALDTLAQQDHPVSQAAIKEGLRAVQWPGRMEVLADGGPLIIVDGAHNPHSASRLVEAVEHIRRLHQPSSLGRVMLLFGALTGHDLPGVLAELARLKPIVVALRTTHPRAKPCKDIEKAATGLGLEVNFQPDVVADAVRRAVAMARPEDVVLATGSLSVAAEVRAAVKGITQETYPNLKQPAK